MNEYQEFLKRKAIIQAPSGLDTVPELCPKLFNFQRDIVRWALMRGRAAIFADCGLGKTAMQLEWAKHIPGRVLILAPLAVAPQTVREGKKFGVDVVYRRIPADDRITITNYEMLEHFNPSDYTGIILDESSILKAYDGKFRNSIIESFARTPFRLACTATPAPNDHMELGNHAEFLGVLSRTEMLSTFFVHDGGDTSKWRIKGHAESDFWRWVCSWAVMIRRPSDLGYEDGRFILPELCMRSRVVTAQHTPKGQLFATEAVTLQERQQARKISTPERVESVRSLVESDASGDQWLIWCNLNSEGDSVQDSIPGSVQVSGSDSQEFKEKAVLDFIEGRTKVLISKPTIFGFGLNLQCCRNVVFLGLSDSYEQFYQAVRRCWRFGQNRPVNCWIVTSDLEGAVVQNIQRKEQDASRMADEMVSNMHSMNEANIRSTSRTAENYTPFIPMTLPRWLVAS